MEHISYGSEMAQAVLATIEATKLCGQYWPNSAVYAITYSTKCWPCGWDEPSAVFFDDVKGCRAWLRRYREWEQLEDNYFEVCSFYEWDWGPSRRETHEFYSL